MLVSSSLSHIHTTTTLLDAAKDGHVQEVWWALEKGGDVNVISLPVYWTPLMYASHRGHAGVVRLLVNVPDVDVDAGNLGGRTALIHATIRQHVEVVCLLLVIGKADVNHTDILGYTPLHSAACMGAVRSAEMLLAVPGIDPGLKNDNGDTALGCAHARCNHAIVNRIEFFYRRRRHSWGRA